MKPLLLLAVGRSGTTYLMRLLAAHPQVIAHEAYPLEFMPFLGAMSPEPHVIDSLKQYRFKNDVALLHGKLDRDRSLTVEEAYAVYRQLASLAGKTPAYFAEKCWAQDIVNKVVHTTAGARFVGLMRDPRDVFFSARAFDRKRGFRGFVERDGDSDEEVVEKYRRSFDKLLDKIDLTRAPVLRYEDLVLRPIETLTGLLEELGLDADPALVAQCQRFAERSEDGRHVTSSSQAASIGRWRTGMPETLKALCRERLAPVLERFSYGQ